ncbi:putative uncharacterized protein DDB_G0271606 [Drosophila obscura]|uniref:putative uncharacterized protein DDB_G0271606 n=1 Tax=Drosophila obscura TaxID=7282 RepID=UPI001BB224AA|nr:putative uncharacterized protein DDB_G0271606 [Drosophila obscura]
MAKISQPQPQAAVQTVTEAPVLVEQSTESPIADMALIEDAPMAPKSPTEKPPVAVEVVEQPQQQLQQPKAEEKAAVQPHTVADFIIHPLIAFKPRQSALDELQGKQANTGGSSSPASPGTWLFGMNPAQGLGSSFSTLAGSVSGWFNDRLAAAGQQLPGLVDTPVRESTTTSSTTSSTTTQRPDVVVRLQQRPQRGQRPANGNGNRNGNGNGNGNRRQRPNRFNDRPNNSNNNRLDDSFEDDYYDEDDYFQGNRFDEEFDDEEADDLALNDEQSLEQFEDEDEQSVEQQQQKRRPQQQKPRRKQQSQQVSSQRKKVTQQESVAPAPTKRRQQQAQSKPQQQQQQQQEDDDEEAEDDDEEEENDNENDSDSENENQSVDDDSEEQFVAVPEPALFGQSGTRRSQNQPNFIQRGQQSLISQIRQFTRGQSPGELGTVLRRTSQSGGGSAGGSLKARRPQQTTLLVNRNGQTVYVAPELLNLGAAYPYAYVPSQAKKQRVPVGAYPQPPLTVPIRRQGRPTQYITIPWSQLGLSPPEQQSMVSLAEGIQAQPLILNIPQSAINPVRGSASATQQQQQQQQQKRKKRPQLTASAVPLLAEASLMDIFQPPQIPPSRTGSTNKPIANQPVLIAAKPVKAAGNSGAALLPTRIRPGTIVEKAPAVEAMASEMQPASVEAGEQKQKEKEMMVPLAVSTEVPLAGAQASQDQEFILVGDDDEPGLTRHVQPAYGDARYVAYGDFHPYFDLLHQNRRFALRKSGRSLEPQTEQKLVEQAAKGEQTKEEPIKEVAKEEPAKEVAKEEPIKEVAKEEPAKEQEQPAKQEEQLPKEEPKAESVASDKVSVSE